MFKKTEVNRQLNLFTTPENYLGTRAAKKYADPNAWHNIFNRMVTSKIDEDIFQVLFPE